MTRIKIHCFWQNGNNEEVHAVLAQESRSVETPLSKITIAVFSASTVFANLAEELFVSTIIEAHLFITLSSSLISNGRDRWQI
jgi:hypothetical protein